MNEKYILLDSCDGENGDPRLFDTLDEARAAMKADLIEAMNGKDESIFNEHEKDADYSWEPDNWNAWFYYRHVNYAWSIFTIDNVLQWIMNAKKMEASGNPESNSFIVAFSIDLKQEDIDDIICSALEGGICYWCSKAEVIGDYLGNYAHEQISRGGHLLLHDAENDKKYELTKEKLMKGLQLFFSSGYSNNTSIKNSSIDPGEFDGNCADMVIQLALFGEIVYS